MLLPQHLVLVPKGNTRFVSQNVFLFLATRVHAHTHITHKVALRHVQHVTEKKQEEKHKEQ